jgi:hypothetical protein
MRKLKNSGLWTGAMKAAAIFRRNTAAPSWTGEIARVTTDLRSLNGTTEADFLSVGENLMKFLSAAQEIRTNIAQLATAIAGGAGERACGALATVREAAVAMQKRIEDASHTLAGLHASVGEIRRSFLAFRDVVLSFQVVATLGRIETARLGGADSDIGHLTDEVRACTESIQKRVEHALSVATLLEERIQATIERRSNQDLRQLKALPPIVRAVEEDLAAFRQRQEQANETSAHLDVEFGSFTGSVNNLATALQFHDITRQRIEHVVESLEQVQLTADAGALIHLQNRQLEDAAKGFMDSVGTVERELEQVAAQAGTMEELAEQLLGLAEDRESPFFSQMERCFADVLAAVSNCATLNRETADATRELQGSIAKLQTCVDDIRAIEYAIGHLAINATIKAEHLGAIAAPLSVVAGAMKTLHGTAENRSEETQRLLSAVTSSALSMMPDASASPASGSDAGVIDGLRARIAELHAASEHSIHGSDQIRGAVATLCAGVASASNHFTVATRFTETIARCSGALQAMIGGDTMNAAPASGELQHLMGRYTMVAEREIHEQGMVRETAEAAPAALCPVAAQDSSQDLGDNVELF